MWQKNNITGAMHYWCCHNFVELYVACFCVRSVRRIQVSADVHLSPGQAEATSMSLQ